MNIKEELGRVAQEMARLKFELFQLDSRRADIVNEVLKLQGQAELLMRLDGTGGRKNASPHPEVKPPAPE